MQFRWSPAPSKLLQVAQGTLAWGRGLGFLLAAGGLVWAFAFGLVMFLHAPTPACMNCHPGQVMDFLMAPLIGLGILALVLGLLLVALPRHKDPGVAARHLLMAAGLAAFLLGAAGLALIPFFIRNAGAPGRWILLLNAIVAAGSFLAGLLTQVVALRAQRKAKL